MLLMSGNVEPNPGPFSINMGCVNFNSIVNKGALVQNLTDNHSLDALAVCETKIVNDDPDAIQLDAAPDGYNILHLPRPTATR